MRSPYRCCGCGERFWVISRKSYRVAGVAAVFVAILALDYGTTGLLIKDGGGNIHHDVTAASNQ
jgi:hypothetical protein